MITRTQVMGVFGMLGIIFLLYATTSAIDAAVDTGIRYTQAPEISP